MLLAYDANVHVKDQTGRTPLFWASFSSDVVIMLALLDATASPYDVDIHNRTCFSILGQYDGVEPDQTELCRGYWVMLSSKESYQKIVITTKTSKGKLVIRHPRVKASKAQSRKQPRDENQSNGPCQHSCEKKRDKQPAVQTDYGKQMYNPILDGLTPRERIKSRLVPLGLYPYDCGSGGKCWFKSVTN